MKVILFMFNISEILANYKPKERPKTVPVWAEMVGKFTDKLNIGRKKELWKRYHYWLHANKLKDSKENQDKFRKYRDKKKGYYPPHTYKYVAMKLADSQVKKPDHLYLFWGYCDDAQNFNKTFFWALSPNTKNGGK